ncbi:unnamed protein product [Closterium sp. NIES-54]
MPPGIQHPQQVGHPQPAPVIMHNGFPTKVMASNICSKDDALSLLVTDYLVVPLKPWDMARFMANIGPCARQLLQAEIDSAVSQAEKVDKHFKKIWPPPNV